MLALHKAIDV